MKGEGEKTGGTNLERSKQGKILLLAMLLLTHALLHESLQLGSFLFHMFQVCQIDMRRSARDKRIVFSESCDTGWQ
jgi:hypothetical protein